MRFLRRGRWPAVALAGMIGSVTVAPGLAASAAAVTSGPTPATARLQGQFQLAGHITVAKRVLGERRGQNFLRIWTFLPTCAVGACDAVGLIRERSGGADRLLLLRHAPGLYAGSGRFSAPLRCGRRTYPIGQSVPFTITVRITAAALSGSGVVATRVSATYTNRARTNLTPCFALLGHDSATYHGHQFLAPGQS